MWVNDYNELAVMKDGDNYSATSARIAGLQVKASKDGIKYVLPAILADRYDVPIIYFDIEMIIIKF